MLQLTIEKMLEHSLLLKEKVRDEVKYHRIEKNLQPVRSRTPNLDQAPLLTQAYRVGLNRLELTKTTSEPFLI
jgi:hypothetical protein